MIIPVYKTCTEVSGFRSTRIDRVKKWMIQGRNGLQQDISTIKTKRPLALRGRRIAQINTKNKQRLMIVKMDDLIYV